MAINKVEANGETLIDLTGDTVTADTLVSGRTAHLASGELVTGTFEPVTGVKGNAESAYRKGNVNLTPANIGAATSAQGDKADSAVQTIQISGTTQTKTSGTVNLPAYPTKSSLGLGNVDNTSDANKPISTATQEVLNKQQAQIDKALEQTGYNLLEITSTTQTTSGVTFTVNKAAGTIRADGTATADIYYNISVPSNVYGNICLSGCPSGGGNTTYDVFPRDNTAGARPKRWDGKTTAESIYSDNQWAEVKYVQGHSNLIQIRIRSGVTVSNLVFKPMIVPTELAGVPFQPYAMSNMKLTQKALIKEDDNAGGYVVYFDKDCKLQRNGNYINLRNNSINLHADSSNISLQCGTTGSPLRGVSITSTAVRMYFGLNTLTVDEDGLWFNDTKIAE